MAPLPRTRSVAADGRRFFLQIAALTAALLAVGALHWYVSASLYDERIRQGVLFARAVTDGHGAMLDQETGLRGYQVAGDPEFLGPYRNGQAEFLRNSALAWQLLPEPWLGPHLLAVQEGASAWQTQHAVPQLAVTAPGRPAPPSDRAQRRGKELFDAYRATHTSLLREVRTSNSGLMDRRELLDRGANGLQIGLASLALLLAARRRRALAGDLVRPVRELTDVLHRLAEGEEGARPERYPSGELDELADGVRRLAEAAQRRREEADAERAASAARAQVYEQVLAVAHELGSYLDPADLAAALLLAVAQVADLDGAVLRGIRDGVAEEPLGALPGTADLPVDAVAAEALRFLRLAASEDAREWALPVLHAGTVHGLLQVRSVAPLSEDSVLALRNLALAAGGALTAARLHEQVRAESRSDALTGLHNRRRFEEDLQHELGLASRTGVPLSLLLLDVDHFKRYNDTRGHRDGDRLLHDLASLLTLTLRASDSAYRYGGEELAVLLRGTTAGDAASLAERLRATVEGRTPVTVSVGVVTAAGSAAPDAVVEAADAALYEAKHAGRNAVRAGRLGASEAHLPQQRAG